MSWMGCRDECLNGRIKLYRDLLIFILKLRQLLCTQLVLITVCGCCWVCDDDDVKGKLGIPHQFSQVTFPPRSPLIAATEESWVLISAGGCR